MLLKFFFHFCIKLFIIFQLNAKISELKRDGERFNQIIDGKII